MVINSNNVAEKTASNLAVSNRALSSSLFRLSSGSKIVNPSDDAAGLAVSSRIDSKLKRINASLDNIGNAISFTQTQDGFLQTANKAVARMGELSLRAQDATKSNKDRELYDKEFQQLKDFVLNLETKEFNEVPLFSDDDIKVTIDSTGTEFTLPAINLYRGQLLAPVSVLKSDGTNAGNTSTDYYVDAVDATAHENADEIIANVEHLQIKDDATALALADTQSGHFNLKTAHDARVALVSLKAAISRIAEHRAKLGAIESRLSFTNSQLTSTKENMGEAKSRITDVNVAEEATNFARFQILAQSGTSMLSQANAMPKTVLQLLT